MSLTLNSELTYLSACNTGQGEQVEGEGVMALTRAFTIAGSDSVGVTLWSVDDRAAAELSIALFRALPAGHAPAAALRQAKLDLLASQAHAHPYFWAPAVLFGLP